MMRAGKQGAAGVLAGGLAASLSLTVTGAVVPTLFGLAALTLCWLIAAGDEPRRPPHAAATGFAGAVRLAAGRMIDMAKGRRPTRSSGSRPPPGTGRCRSRGW